MHPRAILVVLIFTPLAALGALVLLGGCAADLQPREATRPAPHLAPAPTRPPKPTGPSPTQLASHEGTQLAQRFISRGQDLANTAERAIWRERAEARAAQFAREERLDAIGEAATVTDKGLAHGITMARRHKLGFRDWGAACSAQWLDLYHADRCYRLTSTDYEAGKCRVAQKALLKARPIIRIDNVFRLVDYDPRRRRFEIVLPTLLTGNLQDEDCWRERCESVLVTTRPIKFGGGRARYAQWSKRHARALSAALKSTRRVFVNESELLDPESFEDELRAEALVVVVDQKVSAVGEWFYLDDLVVRVVGLRLSLPDLSWSKVFVKGPKAVSCTKLWETGWGGDLP